MKKIFTLLTLLVGLCTGAWAQITAKKWDFTTLSSADKSALITPIGTNSAKFTDNTGNKYVGNAAEWTKDTDYELEDANGDAIATYDGLKFGRVGNTVSAGAFRFYYGTGEGEGYIYFNNSNCYVKLPEIEAGKEVVIKSKDYNTAPTVDNANNDISTTSGEQKFTVKNTGTVMIKFNPKMANLQSIEVRTKVTDTTAPTLSSISPTADAINVLPNGNIVLTFDESVKKVGENVTATLNGSNITGSISGNIVTFAYADLSLNTEYNFSLPANQISDAADNNYASAINCSFTTIGQSVVWPFKSTALDQAAQVYVTPSSDIASYIIEKGSNVKNFQLDATKGTYAYVNSSNSDYNSDTYIFFKITPATGKAFVPTAVEYDASKVGSDNPRIQAYWVNGDGTETLIGSEVDPVRDAPTLVSSNVTSFTLANGVCGLKLYYKGGASNKGIGLWNIKLIGTVVSTVSVSIGEYEWATFVSDQILDFTGLNVKAYAVTGRSDHAISKSDALTTVPANTPVLLNANEGNYNIPVAASATSIGTNLLKAGDGSAVSAEDGKTKYVLSVVGGAAGFKKITAGNPATVAEGKAYLEFNEVISARDFLNFEEGATGVNELKIQKADNLYFNLAGQRVAQPTKGLYIVNGKKVIVK